MADLYDRIKEKEAEKERQQAAMEARNNELLKHSAIMLGNKIRKERQKKYPFLSSGGGLIGIVLSLIDKKKNGVNEGSSH